jgi:hypothetical protein
MDITTASNARVKLARPIHKKMRGSFSFSLPRMQKKLRKQIPVMNKARGHENCGSRSGSVIGFRFTGLIKAMAASSKIIRCKGQLKGNITCVNYD